MKKQSVFSIVSLLCLSIFLPVFIGCSAHKQACKNISDVDAKISIPGISFLPIEDEGWSYSKLHQGKIFFGKITNKEGQSFAGMITLSKLPNLKSENNFLELIIKQRNKDNNNSRYKDILSDEKISHEKDTLGVRFYKKYKDFEAKNLPSTYSYLIIEDIGVTFIHPFNKNIAVTVALSQRSKLEDIDENFYKLAEKFIDGVTFKEFSIPSNNHTQSLKKLRELADNGNIEAQNKIANIYIKGEGVERDYKLARKYYEKAAEQNNANAQFALGTIYENGLGVLRDYNEALKWYKLAIKQGNKYAENNLGAMYEHGQGIKKDYKEAFKWYLNASNKGYAMAQNNLGVMYINATGVDRDYKEAFKWFTQAAKQGNYYAPYNLANLYKYGRGVKKDYVQALKWFKIAANNGHSTSQYNLGNFYLTGKGVKKDYKKAIKWLMKASDKNNPKAQNQLGIIYQYALGAQKNNSEAVKWYSLAIKNGYKNAKCNIIGPLLSIDNSHSNKQKAKKYAIETYEQTKYDYCKKMIDRYKF